MKLASTEEYVDGVSQGVLGDVLIRCNNVLYIRGLDGQQDDGGEEENGEMEE